MKTVVMMLLCVSSACSMSPKVVLDGQESPKSAKGNPKRAPSALQKLISQAAQDRAKVLEAARMERQARAAVAKAQIG